MRRTFRNWLIGVALATVFTAGFFLALVPARASLAGASRRVNQTIPPPTTVPPTPQPDPFQATVYVTPSLSSVELGGQIAVAVTTVITPSCRFPIYAVALNQDDTLFAFENPPSNVIQLPGSQPAIFHLLAVRLGQTRLSASVYGERDCNDYFAFETVRGSSEAVTVTTSATVTGAWHTLALPLIRTAP